MAVLLTQDLPVPIDVVVAVGAEMNAASDPPDGLIVHTAISRGDSTHIVDVWESREHYQKFAESRLQPAVAKVTSARGIEMDMSDSAIPVFEDLGDLIRGR
jgi:hypothetical protein